MRFLYKIYTRYDGFTPQQIPVRLQDEHFLTLGWTRYLDEVSPEDECWIYFHGHSSVTPGVYAKGFVQSKDSAQGTILLRVREYSMDEPLTDAATSAKIASVVSLRFRQVFLWPKDWDVVPQCEIAACAKRLCETCATWNSLPLIDVADLQTVVEGVDGCVPAFWIAPNRCYVYQEGKTLMGSVRTATHIFGEFKLGEKRYAYPLARGIYEALRRRNALQFDAIVPIPLSPDKEANGELHRTRVLSSELGALLGIKVREQLGLTEPISKRRLMASGVTRHQFEERYRRALKVDEGILKLGNVLLVDDVITRGSTTSVAAGRLRQGNPELRITVASAGQMIVKAAVHRERGFVD